MAQESPELIHKFGIGQVVLTEEPNGTIRCGVVTSVKFTSYEKGIMYVSYAFSGKPDCYHAEESTYGTLEEYANRPKKTK